MNARYYSASTGQFTTRDTYLGNVYNPSTHNLYTYTGNNPINFIDPTGHFGMTFENTYGQYSYWDPMDSFSEPDRYAPNSNRTVTTYTDSVGAYKTTYHWQKTKFTGPFEITTTGVFTGYEYDFSQYDQIFENTIEMNDFPNLGLVNMAYENKNYNIKIAHSLEIKMLSNVGSYTVEGIYGSFYEATEQSIGAWGINSKKISTGTISYDMVNKINMVQGGYIKTINFKPAVECALALSAYAAWEILGAAIVEAASKAFVPAPAPIF